VAVAVDSASMDMRDGLRDMLGSREGDENIHWSNVELDGCFWCPHCCRR
jgi:hypothetical protein